MFLVFTIHKNMAIEMCKAFCGASLHPSPSQFTLWFRCCGKTASQRELRERQPKRDKTNFSGIHYGYFVSTQRVPCKFNFAQQLSDHIN